jgi:hypothetical protein
MRVHPRASGGASSSVVMVVSGAGPSPRERGSLDALTPDASDRGSIPARAGEPPPLWSWWSVERVHPRASGGACGDSVIDDFAGGPSSRERGSRMSMTFYEYVLGSIPARAGEPGTGLETGIGNGVHPRASGGAWSEGGGGGAKASSAAWALCCASTRGAHRIQLVPTRTGAEETI